MAGERRQVRGAVRGAQARACLGGLVEAASEQHRRRSPIPRHPLHLRTERFDKNPSQ